MERDQIDNEAPVQMPEPQVEEIEQSWVALCCCSSSCELDLG